MDNEINMMADWEWAAKVWTVGNHRENAINEVKMAFYLHDAIAEIKRLNEIIKKWQNPSIKLLLNGTSYSCDVADVGHSEVSLVIECAELVDDLE